jgi:hypothetical protein
MIELLVVALLQATDPETAPPAAAPTETVTESPTAAPETSENVQVVGDEQRATRCDRRVQAGSRVRQRQVTCTTAEGRDAAAERARELSQSGGAAGAAGEIGRD